MKEILQCPKCKDEMLQGFVVDFGHGNVRSVSSWIKGPPKKSFWTGTKIPSKEKVPIGAFRCKGCGFLEFYSNKGFAAQ
jgi:predicted nucleic-acid-binding Zn-ribbon protein